MIQKIKCDLDGTTSRVETGAVQFEYSNGRTDWNGLFIRGDNAAYLAFQIDSLLSKLKDKKDLDMTFEIAELEHLKRLIQGEVII